MSDEVDWYLLPDRARDGDWIYECEGCAAHIYVHIETPLAEHPNHKHTLLDCIKHLRDRIEQLEEENE